MREFKELAYSPTASKRFIWNLNPGNIASGITFLTTIHPRLPGEGQHRISGFMGFPCHPIIALYWTFAWCSTYIT